MGTIVNGVNGVANSGKPGVDCFGYNSNVSGTLQPSFGSRASEGQEIFSIVAVTPGQVISYIIGAGGTAGSATSGPTAPVGGSGKIEVEYWA